MHTYIMMVVMVVVVVVVVVMVVMMMMMMMMMMMIIPSPQPLDTAMRIILNGVALIGNVCGATPSFP